MKICNFSNISFFSLSNTIFYYLTTYAERRGICSTQFYPDRTDEKKQPTCMRSTYEKRNRNLFAYGRGLKYKINFGPAFENEIIQYLQDSRLPVTIGRLEINTYIQL